MTGQASHRKSVLVVDDDDLVRASIVDTLSTYGMDVIGVRNGRECLQVLKRREMDAVIVDLIMPEMDGLETIALLRHDRPNLKILAISGGGRTKNVDLLSAAGRIGATAVLSKPFEPGDLIKRLRAMDEYTAKV